MDITGNYLRSAASTIESARASRGSEDDVYWLGHLATAIQHLEAAQKSAVMTQRARGESWAAIGYALGISKQAAQQRYGELWRTYQRDVLLIDPADRT